MLLDQRRIVFEHRKAEHELNLLIRLDVFDLYLNVFEEFLHRLIAFQQIR
jgi:hypothetical protein